MSAPDIFALGGRQDDAERTARFAANFEALDPHAKDAVESAALALARSGMGADPLLALWAERCRLDAEYIAMPDDVDDVDPRVLAINARLNEIDDQLETLVPASAGGAAVLVRYVKSHMVGFLWDERHDRIADNLIAGLERLGRGDAA